ncbi:transglutaminase family protein [Bradyrhizobium sp. YCK136]|uniref:transglutaminase-like domain-containing protein n=1 Tax=Bradyrhizobium TaxID=374 RepID=UPI001FEEAA89|nr:MULTISPECIES: transglutaminase-like domain-containing protein [Bradyrhizobium]
MTARTAPGTQTLSTTLELRIGTCRDFAVLMIEAARSLGFAARFITGYPRRGQFLMTPRGQFSMARDNPRARSPLRHLFRKVGSAMRLHVNLSTVSTQE